MSGNQEVTYTVVGDHEADIKAGRIAIWDAATHKQVALLAGHDRDVLALGPGGEVGDGVTRGVQAERPTHRESD